jgi:osmotically-inducible protein OsmY
MKQEHPMEKRSVRRTRKPRRGSARSTTTSRESDIMVDLPHRVEKEVQHHLLSHPHLNFSSLVIHRIDRGVCLEGVLEADEETPDVECLVQEISGVDEVINHLVVRRRQRVPAKG